MKTAFDTLLFVSIGIAAAAPQECIGEKVTRLPGISAISSIAAIPGTSALVAGTHDSGVFRSLDGGLTWTSANVLRDPNQPDVPRLLPTAVRQVAHDPSTPGRLYAVAPPGLYRSDDMGDNWYSLQIQPNTSQPAFSCFGVAPSDPDTIVAGEGGAALVRPLYITRNGGGSWSMFHLGYPISQCGVHVKADDASHFLFTSAGGSRRSLDGGSNWTPVDLGVASHLAMAPVPGAPSRLLSASQSGFLVSDDFGGTWSNLAGTGSLWNGGLPISLHVDPASPSRLFVSAGPGAGSGTSTGIFRSLDGGSTWFEKNVGLPTPAMRTIEDIVSLPGDSGTVIAGGAKGLFRSTDNGDSWINAGIGLPSFDVKSIGCSVADPAFCLAGVRDHGVFSSLDGGESWQPVVTDLPTEATGQSIAFDAIDGAKAYAVVSGELFRTTSAAGGWTRLFPPLSLADSVLAHGGQAGWIYVRGSGGLNTLVMSRDSGTTWENVGGLSGRTVTGVVPDPSEPSRYFVMASALFRSLPDQASVAKVSDESFSVLAVSPFDGQVLLAGKGSVLYRSDSGGESWSTVTTSGLPAEAVVRLAFDWNVPDLVFALTETGKVLGSFDGGATWEVVGSAEAARSAFSLEYRLLSNPASAQPGKNAPRPSAELLIGRSGGIVSRYAAAATAADFDGDGIPNGLEKTEGTSAWLKDNDIFSATLASSRLFARQQFRDFLGREADPYGLDFWSNAVFTGSWSRQAVIDAFLGSPEFGGSMAPVVRLYFSTFLRVPDYGGLTYNAGLVRAGTVTLAQLADFFTASPEFQATYGALDNTAFVTLLYNNILGRAPDAGGLSGWVGALDGGMTRGQALLGFSESPENVAAMANEVFVTMMYAGMLRRTPEAGGFSSWVAWLDAGSGSRELVISGFFQSAEYRGRFLP